MKYCRINLSQTDYNIVKNSFLLVEPPIDKLKYIFKQYCKYKKFEAVMPIFDSQYTDANNDILGYYDNSGKLVAFSLVRRHDKVNAESVQFAWDYANPKLRLGILSLETECAFYKAAGYKYLYLGISEEYKTKFDGYEEIKADDV